MRPAVNFLRSWQKNKALKGGLVFSTSAPGERVLVQNNYAISSYESERPLAIPADPSCQRTAPDRSFSTEIPLWKFPRLFESSSVHSPLIINAAARPVVFPPANTLSTRSLGVQRLKSHSRSFASGSGSSNVVEVSSSEEFDTLLRTSDNKLVVVDFTAAWCRPCKDIAPVLDALSLETRNVAFIKLDIDKEELHDAVQKAGIQAVPTFQFYKSNKLVSSFSGADAQKLKDTIAVLSLNQQ